MNTRVLLIFALLVAILASWLYKEQGSLDNPLAISASNIEYEATDINALQTSTTGDVAYLLKADKLTHYTNTDTDTLENVRLDWRSSQHQRVKLQAMLASINQRSGEVQLSQDVVLSSQNLNDNSDASAFIPLILSAKTINGNLQQQTLYSQQPVMVKQGDNRFEANGFTSNLQTGEYEFEKVAVTFQPPVRQDVPLF